MQISSKIPCTLALLSSIFLHLPLFTIIGPNTSAIPLIPRTVLFGNPEKAGVSISPDGTRLAYVAPVDGVLNLWVKTIGCEDDRAITNARGHGVQNYFWAENGKQILFGKDHDGDENWHLYKVELQTLEITDLTPFPGVRTHVLCTNKHFPDTILIEMNREDPKLFDVYRLELTTNALTLAAKNPGNVTGWLEDAEMHVRGAVATNPDGGRTLLIRNAESEPWVAKLVWDRNDTTDHPLHFSADGNSIYLLDSRNANTRRLVKFDLTTGAHTIIASDEHYDLGNVAFSDTHEPDVAVFNRDRCEWRVLNPELDDDFARILANKAGDLALFERSADGTKWILGFENDTSPFAYYLYDSATKQKMLLFYNKPALANYKLAPMEPIALRSRDGLSLHGYITKPVNAPQKNLPMVLLVHGGPRARDTWGYDSLAQWLANRGYACLQINFRGSTGYGKDFVNAGNKEWGGKMHDDLIDAVNWAIDSGIADPARIAIFGASYGGYAALVGATATPEIFRCAVDLFGPSNLFTFLASIPPYWETARAELHNQIGDPETDNALLRERSPLFKIDQIKIPILIAQGANDPRVKQAESEQIVAAMKERGLPYEYILFPDEGHGLARPENRMAFFTAAEKFLAKHLGGICEE